MKTMRIFATATAAAALLGLVSASPASGAPTAAQSQNEKTLRGTVTSVDVPDHILSVRGFMFTRNFNTANDCRVSLEDKSSAGLADLHPGQQVDVRYQDNNGVLIAQRISQHNLGYSGHITAIDTAHGTILVRHGVMTREFAVPVNCEVRMRNENVAGLGHLQLGDNINIVYERENGAQVIRRIEQNSASYVGTIQAIDLSTRTVKARDAKGEKQFSLADNCSIVINGKLADNLNNLMIGERATFSYDNVDGVLVANRVSPMTEAAPTAPARSAEQSESQLHAFNN
jgi:hypothetical protein